MHQGRMGRTYPTPQSTEALGENKNDFGAFYTGKTTTYGV